MHATARSTRAIPREAAFEFPSRNLNTVSEIHTLQVQWSLRLRIAYLSLPIVVHLYSPLRLRFLPRRTGCPLCILCQVCRQQGDPKKTNAYDYTPAHGLAGIIQPHYVHHCEHSAAAATFKIVLVATSFPCTYSLVHAIIYAIVPPSTRCTRNPCGTRIPSPLPSSSSSLSL